MKENIENAKLEYFHKRSQYIVLDADGKATSSCNTIFSPPTDISLYTLIPFLEGMQSSFAALEPGKNLRFLCIQTKLLDAEGYFNFIFKKQESGSIIWFIYDFTEFYTYLLPWQQERNERAIESEQLKLQRKADALEKQLLQYQNRELQRIQEMKTVFFSQVSHEIRTPLHSLVGLINLIEPYSTPKSRTYIEAMRSVSHHLSSIINDVLDLSKLDAGEIQLNTYAFSLQETAEKLVHAFLFQSQEKQLKLYYELDPALPTYLQGDEVRLSQILYNLLGNAIKFTSEGEVQLKISMQKKEEERVSVSFEVIDSGIGISEEGMQKIFAPFVQANNDIHRYYGGTGLGLSIVQKLIQLMEGELQVESKEGVGTHMKVSLPFRIAEIVEDQDVLQQKDVELRHIKHALIGEDDLMNQKVLRLFLQQKGIESTVEENGAEVLKSADDKAHELLILDYQMPGLNGLEVIEQLDRKGNQKPVILLSGNLQMSQKLPERSGSLAFVLNKPLQPEVLLHKLQLIDYFLEPAIDLQYLHKITDGNHELFADLLSTFLQQAPQELRKIKKAYAEEDIAALYKAVHKAKPGFQCICSPRMKSFLDLFETKIEKSLRTEQYADDIQLINCWLERAISEAKLQQTQYSPKL